MPLTSRLSTRHLVHRISISRATRVLYARNHLPYMRISKKSLVPRAQINHVRFLPTTRVLFCVYTR